MAGRYRLQDLLEGFQLNSALALLLKLPLRADPHLSEMSRGKRLRLALEELGPIFIKFGQLLSTRRDMLPLDIADELAYLQDQVAPFDGEQAREIIEKSLGSKIETVFKDFSSEPLASASVAQVHTATLHTGEEVVIKVIRPGIGRISCRILPSYTNSPSLLKTSRKTVNACAPGKLFVIMTMSFMMS